MVEAKRLIEHPPLVTILLLTIGPFCSQITSTLYGIINTIWISRYIGEIGMSAVAVANTWEGLCRAFGLFLSIAGSSQISALYGQKKYEETSQVACDLYRTALVCGCIIPAILLPINKPFSKWFKASEETVQLAYDYTLPQAAGNVLTCLFFTNVGFLQAEGRTILVGIIDIVSLGIGMGVLNPLFLGKLKSGIEGPSYSTIIADGVPGIILTILFFCGKFTVKPKLRGSIRPFARESWQALLVGCSQLISQLSLFIPGIIMRRLIGLSLQDRSQYDNVMAGYNAIGRFTNLVLSVVLALYTGFLPAASYAYGAKMYRRYIRLSIHLNWTTFAWCIIALIVGVGFPAQFALIFGKGDGYMEWTVKELIACNWGVFILFARYTIQTMLQSQQRGKRAMIISFTSNFVITIAFCYVMYYAYPAYTERILWSFSIASVFGFFLGMALIIKPFIDIVKALKETSDQVKEKELDDEEEETEPVPAAEL